MLPLKVTHTHSREHTHLTHKTLLLSPLPTPVNSQDTHCTTDMHLFSHSPNHAVSLARTGFHRQTPTRTHRVHTHTLCTHTHTHTLCTRTHMHTGSCKHTQHATRAGLKEHESVSFATCGHKQKAGKHKRNCMTSTPLPPYTETHTHTTITQHSPHRHCVLLTSFTPCKVFPSRSLFLYIWEKCVKCVCVCGMELISPLLAHMESFYSDFPMSLSLSPSARRCTCTALTQKGGMIIRSRLFGRTHVYCFSAEKSQCVWRGRPDTQNNEHSVPLKASFLPLCSWNISYYT